MIAPLDPFYVEPPTIAPGMTIGEYRRARPVKRRLLARLKVVRHGT